RERVPQPGLPAGQEERLAVGTEDEPLDEALRPPGLADGVPGTHLPSPHHPVLAGGPDGRAVRGEGCCEDASGMGQRLSVPSLRARLPECDRAVLRLRQEELAVAAREDGPD